ncbi:MAG: glycosyltransferase family 4 protein [Candidatus Eisenbacteria bacterium]|nr:glycosyltransferase family 4 protein [Candidatus Eisenbacteria bacterium]
MTGRLRILQITHQGDFGGSTNSITWLTEGLSGRGHALFLCVRPESLLAERFAEHPRVRVVPFDFGRSLIHLGRSRRLARLCTDLGVDVVNAHASLDRHLTIQARRLFRGRFRLVHTRRNAPLSSGGRLQGWYYGACTDRIIAVSGGVAEGMVRGGVPRERIAVVHNGIPLDRYRDFPQERVRAAREDLGIAEGERVVGMMARRKGQDELLRAMAFVEEPATILLLGIDRDEGLEEIRRSLRLPHRVIYGGFRHDVLPYYPILSVFVLPSTIEGFSLSILEAMAFGLPVVCTDAGGNAEAVEEGVNGHLFRPGDTGAFGAAVRGLLGDEALRRAMGERGREKVFARFGVDRTVEKAEAVYLSLTER